MVASPRVEDLKHHLPALGSALAGVAVAAGFALTPVSALESLIWASGIVSLVPAAEPPIGIAIRAGLAVGMGTIVAAVTWSVLYLLLGPGGFLAGREEPGALAVRRADAHPDAPPRRPLFAAADLGTPLMDVRAAPAERPLPRDLDLPLAAFDPEAVPDIPMAPVPAVASLVGRPQIFDPGDRLETFDLTPVVRAAAPASPKAMPSPSVETLLRRLEQGARRRERSSLSSLDETIGLLRKLAS